MLEGYKILTCQFDMGNLIYCFQDFVVFFKRSSVERGELMWKSPKIYWITDFFEQLPNLDSLFPMQRFILVELASLLL